MDKLIYLDNAATTKTYDDVAQNIAKINAENYFNPSALYKQAVSCQGLVKQAREDIKSYLHILNGELYFLSSGTEADNTALFCTRKAKGSRIIVGLGEHDAIINSANELKNQGYDVQFAPINKDGSVDFQAFKELLTENTSLVSIMHVSNETGAINDIEKFVRVTKKVAPKCIFHSDGVQAFGKINVNLAQLGVDLYSISSHKIHGPKGVGALYVKNGVTIHPLLYGGGQEKGFRSSTENVSGIVGFSQAANRVILNMDANNSKKAEYLDLLKEKLLKNIPDTVVISPENKCANILTVAFNNVRGEVLLHTIEEDGILVGIGSACSSHHESRFKQLLSLDQTHKDGIIRFSVSEFNDLDEVDYVAEKIIDAINKLKNYTRI